jgi:glycyl-tRNA synthetase beta chain
MPDLLLELLSEEIPARMQVRARADLARLLTAELAKAGLRAESVETWSTPRRLALIARGLPLGTPAVSEELKGPRTSAPPQALEGFLRKTGLTPDQLEDRSGVWFSVIEKPGRATSDVLAEAIPAIIRAFPWPKSMRWGAASLSTESLRWVRPLQGIVAMLDEEVIELEVGDVQSGAATVGHRFHHPGRITLAGASDYLDKLNACHVIVDHDERGRLIRDGAAALAEEHGLKLVADEGLVEENAGLTEWPVPLLGRFDPAFLDVPREVIQLTMRTNQKYFALQSPSRLREGSGEGLSKDTAVGKTSPPPPPPASGRGELSPAFICVANVAAADGGQRIVEGNQKVLAARLSDARFFWEQDLKVPLEDQAKKLSQIVFHEKLGTVADKVERVAKLARWLVEEGIVGTGPSPGTGEGGERSEPGEGPSSPSQTLTLPLGSAERAPPSPVPGEGLAQLAERAAFLCKADLVTQMVGEFPELQGLIGGYLAAAQGEDPQVAAAIRDHYKPVGQGDEVPTAPVTVAVSLADKIDSALAFLSIDLAPSGSRDPFAIRRALLGVLATLGRLNLRVSLSTLIENWVAFAYQSMKGDFDRSKLSNDQIGIKNRELDTLFKTLMDGRFESIRIDVTGRVRGMIEQAQDVGPTDWLDLLNRGGLDNWAALKALGIGLMLDRLKVQQREAGVRHDLIDAVFALGGEDDLVRLLARVRALQGFVETGEGADLLSGYKRAANILKKEGWNSPSPGTGEGVARSASAGGEGEGLPDLQRPSPDLASLGHPLPRAGEGQKGLSYTPEEEETALIAALDSAEPRAAEAIAQEDFEGAMAALATLRAPVDAFFDKVTVNDPDPARRAARLDLLARMRAAFHQIADFSRIEG